MILPAVELVESRSQRLQPVIDPPSLHHRLIDSWLMGSNYKPNTQKAYRIHVLAFLAWNGDRPLASISNDRAVRYKLYLLKERQTPKGKGLSVNTVNTILLAVKSFFTWYAAFRMPPGSLSPFKAAKFEKRPPLTRRDLSLENLAKLITAAAQDEVFGPRDVLIVELLRHGLRASEALALNCGAIQNGVIFVAESKTGQSRQVPMLPELEAALDDYLEFCQSEIQYQWEPRSPLVLTLSSSRHRRLTYAGLYKRFAKLMAIAGVEGSPHWLRHTFASDMLRKGIAPEHAMLLMGHGRDAFRRYTIGVQQDAAIAAFHVAYKSE